MLCCTWIQIAPEKLLYKRDWEAGELKPKEDQTGRGLGSIWPLTGPYSITVLRQFCNIYIKFSLRKNPVGAFIGVEIVCNFYPNPSFSEDHASNGVLIWGRRFRRLDEKRIVSLKLAVLLILVTETRFLILIASTPRHLFGGGANKPFYPKCDAHSRLLFEQIYESITYGETRDLWKRQSHGMKQRGNNQSNLKRNTCEGKNTTTKNDWGSAGSLVDLDQ